jgi:hypothetical protein
MFARGFVGWRSVGTARLELNPHVALGGPPIMSDAMPNYCSINNITTKATTHRAEVRVLATFSHSGGAKENKQGR